MRGVLIDTNAYAAFKQGLPDAVDIVQRAPQIFANCSPGLPPARVRRKTAQSSNNFSHRRAS